MRYRSRTYGETKISRFRHGWLLVQMAVFAYRKLKIEIYRPALVEAAASSPAGTRPSGPGVGWSAGCECGGASSGPS